MGHRIRVVWNGTGRRDLREPRHALRRRLGQQAVHRSGSVELLIKNQSLAKARGQPLRWDTRIAEVLGDKWGLMDEEMQRGVTLQDMLSHRTGMPRHDLSGFAREGGVPEMVYIRAPVSSSLSLPARTISVQQPHVRSPLAPSAHAPQPILRVLHHAKHPSATRDELVHLLRADAEARLLPDGLTRQLAHGFHWSMNDSLVNRTGVLTPSEYLQRPGQEKVWAGAAGILASARDLSTWVAMLLNDGRHPFTNTTVIPPDIIEHIALGASVSAKAEYPETSPKVYGCGQNRFSYRGHEIIEHGGSNPGFKSIVTRLPHD
ncbi:beta-lactamase/transpeptidase-like protein [Mycena amicta]|nr:beta-lactamase/transpeptidase-like protein [Mycena amicta]